MATANTKLGRKPKEDENLRIIVEHEFIGTQTITEALTPIIIEDLKRHVEGNRTIDSMGDSA